MHANSGTITRAVFGLISAATLAGCLNAHLRDDLATGRAQLKIDHYNSPALESTPGPLGADPVVTSASLTWVDHVQRKSGAFTVTPPASTPIRGWWFYREPNRSMNLLVPLCDSFPDKCGWVLRVALSTTRAKVELLTITDEIVEELFAGVGVAPSMDLNGIPLSDSEALWYFAARHGDRADACGIAGLVAEVDASPAPGSPGANTLAARVRRLVVTRDMALGACHGGPALVTLKAGSFIEFSPLSHQGCCEWGAGFRLENHGITFAGPPQP